MPDSEEPLRHARAGESTVMAPPERVGKVARRAEAEVTPKARPLLLLDVDGVLSPIAWPPHLPAGIEWIELGPNLFIDARLPGWLGQLGEVFELTWATTWEHSANQILVPKLGLTPLPVIEFNASTKLAAIRRFVGSRPAAWVDDKITSAAKSWARRRNAEVPTLVIKTFETVGITGDHVDELLAFAESVHPT